MVLTSSFKNGLKDGFDHLCNVPVLYLSKPSMVLTLSPSAKLTYLRVYDSRDDVSDHVGSPSPPSSLTNVHRCISSRNGTRQKLPTSAKLKYLSVYDSRDGVSEHASSPSPPSSLTHVHRCIGSRHGTRQTLPTSAKLKYLSMYDNRDDVSEHADSPSSPSSLTHVHRCIGSHNATRQTMPTSAKLTSLSMYDGRNDSVFFATWGNGRRRLGEVFGFSCRLGVSGGTIVSGSCAWPLHLWISRVLTSSSSLGISSLFCRSTQCMWGM